ncbi:SpoIIE family protein phosphatase [Herbiconiux sp. CPCC 205763]|uniref:SpoIIE family protein phosphatase n=1 Tax=Herbiconiux aconitum TaxID=2970913 RepID=A0ABT2GV68_9MICO|nr:SpoIIE family protein phosphatase [Herbiconiux aconitum]MCS5720104.1 SpoIIE family protein phosphatase [Herbiconiux aconitum]
MGLGAHETGDHDDFERLRVAAVERLDLLDTPAEERFDRITRIARELFDVPMAAINLIDDERQFTKSPQIPGRSPNLVRTESFCEVTIEQPDMVVVPDATRDERFAHRHPVTDERHVRFYAGRPLSLGDDLRVGTLCLVDTTPREFGADQMRLLDEMGQWVERELQDTADLDRAAEVQQGLLPQDQPSWPDYDVAGICLPAKTVGGDFYAWYGDGDGASAGTVIELTLADVMGKGAAGAIMAAAVRAAFQSRTGADVVGAVSGVNAQLADDLGGIGSFATLFHATIDTASGRIDYADAGHGLSVIVRRDGAAERLEATGLPIGIVAEGEWTRGRAELAPGDRLVTFTDGVLDLFDGTLASLDEVAAIVRAAPSPHDALARFAELTAATRASDDVTVVVVARRP